MKPRIFIRYHWSKTRSHFTFYTASHTSNPDSYVIENIYGCFPTFRGWLAHSKKVHIYRPGQARAWVITAFSRVPDGPRVKARYQWRESQHRHLRRDRITHKVAVKTGLQPDQHGGSCRGRRRVTSWRFRVRTA